MPRRELKAPASVTMKYSATLLAKLDACRPAGQPTRKCPLTPEQQAALIEYWPKTNHTDLCEALGVTKNTALSWYRKLTKQGNKS